MNLSVRKSVEARVYKYRLNHFDKTEWGNNLKKLKNKYEGKRCFIIGNGPSLQSTDLDRLQNEYTFAFNRIYYIFGQTSWRPTFYCTQDEKIIENSAVEILQNIDTEYLFLPATANWYKNAGIQTNYLFAPKYVQDGPIGFSEDIPSGIFVGNTVVYTAIQLAYYMGFTEIYLIGVDHNFSVYQDKDGEIHRDNSVKDYFCSEYNVDKDKLDIPTLDKSTLDYRTARKFSEEHDFKIYNATRGGKLEVFERVDIEDLFRIL